MSEQLQHKMYEFETAPPAEVWETIAARLNDDEQYATVAAKMNNHTEEAPPGTWNDILLELNNEPVHSIKAPPVSINRKIYRVATAAIITGLLIGGWMIINKADINIGADVKKSISFPATTTEENTNAKKDSPVEKDYNQPNVNSVTGKPYLTVIAPNGQSTRLSPKLMDGIHYLNAEKEDANDHSGKAVWKNRFGEWRNKIRKSTFIPASSNFLDIAELKELIEKEK